MTTNMGSADRWIRGIVGVLGIIAGIVYHSWWGLIGVVLLATAFVGFCPGYLPLKISTRGRKA